ncbi:hypothetical protein N9C25_01130 [Saprospiraceae bacterium]|jgi:hypothetical protein|nr:hypothetical protein [Saprospiraceae bacterium]MDA9872801.1 hypothetical protein [Saprospiraceae bacterium]MDC1289739.1 hypothetical protein [bacterium]|tara:strand:- start:1430 stop:1666 length:237 start_codon:yes stop_codon:yes gene_type:complete
MPNFENMNEIRASINLYFDNALTTDAQQNLLNKVDSDSTCHKIFNQEKNIREFIKNNVTRPDVSPDFIQNIMNNIKIV